MSESTLPLLSVSFADDLAAKTKGALTPKTPRPPSARSTAADSTTTGGATPSSRPVSANKKRRAGPVELATERWLNDQLEHSHEVVLALRFRVDDNLGYSTPALSLKRVENDPTNLAKLPPLFQIGLDRNSLFKVFGVQKQTADKLYRNLFVYSTGFFESMQELVDGLRHKEILLMRIWAVYCELLTQFDSGEYKMMLEKVTDEYDITTQRMREQYGSYIKRIEDTNNSLQKELDVVSQQLRIAELKNRPPRSQTEEEMEKELKRLEKEYEEQVRLRAQYQSELLVCRLELQHMSDKCTDQGKKIETLNGHLQKERLLSVTAQSEVRRVNSRYQESQIDLDTARNDVKRLIKERDRFEAAVSIREHEMEKEKEMKEEYATRCLKAELTIESLEKKVDEKLDVIDNLTTSNALLEKQCEGQLTDITTLQADKDVLIRERDGLKLEILDLHSRIRHQEHEKSIQKTQIASWKMKCQRQKTRTAWTRRLLNKARNSIRSKGVDYDQLRKNFDIVAKGLEDTRMDLKRTQLELRDKGEDNKELTHDLKKLRGKHEELKQKMDIDTQNFQANKKALEDIIRTREVNYKNELDFVNKQWEQSKDEVQKQTMKVAEKERKIHDHQVKIEQLQVKATKERKQMQLVNHSTSVDILILLARVYETERDLREQHAKNDRVIKQWNIQGRDLDVQRQTLLTMELQCDRMSRTMLLLEQVYEEEKEKHNQLLIKHYAMLQEMDDMNKRLAQEHDIVIEVDSETESNHDGIEDPIRLVSGTFHWDENLRSQFLSLSRPQSASSSRSGHSHAAKSRINSKGVPSGGNQTSDSSDAETASGRQAQRRARKGTHKRKANSNNSQADDASQQGDVETSVVSTQTEPRRRRKAPLQAGSNNNNNSNILIDGQIDLTAYEDEDEDGYSEGEGEEENGEGEGGVDGQQENNNMPPVYNRLMQHLDQARINLKKEIIVRRQAQAVIGTLDLQLEALRNKHERFKIDAELLQNRLEETLMRTREECLREKDLSDQLQRELMQRTNLVLQRSDELKRLEYELALHRRPKSTRDIGFQTILPRINQEIQTSPRSIGSTMMNQLNRLMSTSSSSQPTTPRLVIGAVSSVSIGTGDSDSDDDDILYPPVRSKSAMGRIKTSAPSPSVSAASTPTPRTKSALIKDGGSPSRTKNLRRVSIQEPVDLTPAESHPVQFSAQTQRLMENMDSVKTGWDKSSVVSADEAPLYRTATPETVGSPTAKTVMAGAGKQTATIGKSKFDSQIYKQASGIANKSRLAKIKHLAASSQHSTPGASLHGPQFPTFTAPSPYWTKQHEYNT